MPCCAGLPLLLRVAAEMRHRRHRQPVEPVLGGRAKVMTPGYDSRACRRRSKLGNRIGVTADPEMVREPAQLRYRQQLGARHPLPHCRRPRYRSSSFVALSVTSLARRT
jgi:hypothetical protein